VRTISLLASVYVYSAALLGYAWSPAPAVIDPKAVTVAMAGVAVGTAIVDSILRRRA